MALHLTRENSQWSELDQQEFGLQIPEGQLVGEMRTKTVGVEVNTGLTRCDLAPEAFDLKAQSSRVTHAWV